MLSAETVPKLVGKLTAKDQRAVLKALKSLVRLEVTPEGRSLVWVANGRGRYMKKGADVTGPVVRVGSQHVSLSRVAWMLATGQVLVKAQVLFKPTLYIGAEPSPAPLEKWRVIERADLLKLIATRRQQHTEPTEGDYKRLPYTDFNGKKHTVPTVRKSDNPDTPPRRFKRRSLSDRREND